MPAKRSKRPGKDDEKAKPLISLQRCYNQECIKSSIDPLDSFRRSIKNCLEAEKGVVPLEKLAIEPPKPPKVPKRKKETEENDVVEVIDKPPPLQGLEVTKCLTPVCFALKTQNFVQIQELSFFGFPLSLHSSTVFADTMKAMQYPLLKLEFEDCELCQESINRLSQCLPFLPKLKSISFDYNS